MEKVELTLRQRELQTAMVRRIADLKREAHEMGLDAGGEDVVRSWERGAEEQERLLAKARAS